VKKEIWLPKCETRVLVDEKGNVRVWDEMMMELKPIKANGTTGFGAKK
jgi:hypothetical protein